MKLSDAQVAQFHEDGYLLLTDFVSPDLLTPIQEEIEATVDRHARELHAAGELPELHEDQDFFRRLIYLEAQGQKLYSRISVGRLNGPALFRLLVSGMLLDVAEQFVGEEVFCSPTYRVRPKLPEDVRTVVPWHQDVAYLPAEFDETLLLAFWIPLLDTDATNGGMEVIPKHHRESVFRHVNEHYLAIPDESLRVETAIPVSVPFGGALLLHQKTPHRSVPHSKEVVRWSLDIRYQDARLPNGNTTEAGFLARSRSTPESVLRDPAAFRVLRETHEPIPLLSRWS